MLKRSFMIVTLLGSMVPMAAYAGNVSTRVMTAGGTATMGAGAAQTSAAGTVTRFFGTGKYYNTSGVLVPQVDAGTSVAFLANAAAGYVVSEVKLNGVVQPLTSPVVVPAAPKGQSVTIKFARQTVAITANAAPGGSVIPGGTKSGIVGTPLTYVFTPFAGASVQGIAFTGGAATDYALTNAKTGATVTLPFAGPVAVTFTPKAGVNVTMTPSFLAITANAGSNQIVATGSVTLAATSSVAGATFAWTQVGGPALGTPWTSSIAGPTVNLAAPGNYTFQVSATSGTNTATAAVVITAKAGYTPLTTLQTVQNQCVNCHNASTVGGTSILVTAANPLATPPTPEIYSFRPDVYNSYSASANKANGVICTVCHVGAYTGAHPGVATNQDGTTHKSHNLICSKCHTDATGTNGDAHNKAQSDSTGCVDCHAVAQNAGATYVQEGVNIGVRAILGANSEFAKKSHHIFNGVGIAPTNAQCVACHLEGKVVSALSASYIAVDTAYHMADSKIHLRNAHDDTDLAWDPKAATSSDHTNMDNFCMSCHSATGADSFMSTQIQTYLTANPAFTGAPAATHTNPFGDLVSNSYDKQSRVNVVDVNDQFNTTNYSHHAVKGKRYSTRNSASAIAAWKSYSSGGGHSTDTAATGRPSGSFNSSTQKTLYDGGLLGKNAQGNGTLYTPLDTALAGATIGDDSQLHCGDCHTVGQWKAGSSTNADGTPTTAVIGAHGSANEYMLRNSKGTDALHGLGTLVCFNCHNDKANPATGGGGYYAAFNWNNTTKTWSGLNPEGIGHIGVADNSSMAQYGGSNSCVGTTAGLIYTGYTSATHNFVSSGSFAPVGPTKKSASDVYGNNPYYTQTYGLGAQYTTFDANGNFLYAFKYNSATWTSDGNGNGNPSGLDAQGRPTVVGNIFDQDGTVIDPSVFAGTGRNNSANGNILGIGCLNCHNVGRNAATGGGFGGIHGGSLTYATGFSADKNGSGTGALLPASETQSTYRFMPGLGNYAYAPVGSGITTGTATASGTTYTVTAQGTRAASGAAAWEAWNGVGTSGAGGCYTNDFANQNAGWSGCNHHGNGGSATSPANLGKGDAAKHVQGNMNVGRTLNY